AAIRHGRPAAAARHARDAPAARGRPAHATADARPADGSDSRATGRDNAAACYGSRCITLGTGARLGAAPSGADPTVRPDPSTRRSGTNFTGHPAVDTAGAIGNCR